MSVRSIRRIGVYSDGSHELKMLSLVSLNPWMLSRGSIKKVLEINLGSYKDLTRLKGWPIHSELLHHLFL